MVSIEDLQPGDELQCHMKLGFALRFERQINGEVHGSIPALPRTAERDDAVSFRGQVSSNDTVNRILYLHATHIGPRQRPFGDTYYSVVPYDKLKRVRRFSKHSFPARASNPFRPTGNLPTTAYKPYRLLEEVLL